MEFQYEFQKIAAQTYVKPTQYKNSSFSCKSWIKASFIFESFLNSNN